MKHSKTRFSLSALAVTAFVTSGLGGVAPGQPAVAANIVTPMVAVGDVHVLALKSDGTVWAWGGNEVGQLGDGTVINRTTPVPVYNLTGVKAIATGAYSSYALKADGTIWAWGANDAGQLGNNSTIASRVPVQVFSLNGVEAIMANTTTAYARIGKGVWGWGNNSTGQLGVGDTDDRLTPRRVGQPNIMINDVIGWATDGLTLYLQETNRILAVGFNNHGQVGSGVLTNPTVIPAQMGTGTFARGVWAGSFCGYMLDGDAGNLMAAGLNHYGQLGDGTENDRRSPVAVGSLTGVTAMATARESAYALLSDGTVWGWGRNNYGQVGDGSTVTHQTSPQRVGNFSDVSALVAGEYTAYALRPGGTVWAWGSNQYGQIGDSTTTNRNVPKQVGGTSFSGVKSIYPGNYNTVALKNDGSLWFWGFNDRGQAGDGTTTNKTSPVQVKGRNGTGFFYLFDLEIKASIPSSASVGSTIKVTTSGVPTSATVTYQWLRNGTNIPGATSSSYKVTKDDVGKQVSVKVTVKRPGDTAFTVTSKAVKVPALPVLNPTVVISGEAKVGSTLTAKVSGQLPAGWSATYQWLRDGKAISGAKASTYKVQAADAATKLSVKASVTAKNAEPTSVSKISSPVIVSSGTPGGPQPPIPSPGAATGMAQVILSPSLSGSQFGDVLAVDQAGTLWRYPSSATGALGARTSLGSGWSGLTVYAPGDWNHDGKNDVIAVDQVSGKMFLFAGNGAGGLGLKVQIGQGWGGFRVIPAGDLNGDSFVDLLVIKQATGELFLYAGDGKGGFKYPYPKVGYGWTGFDLYAASDINKDGLADILSIDSKGDLFFYAGKGDGTFAKKIQVGNGWGGYQLSAGADLNGDGMADIVSVDSKGVLFFYAAKGGGLFAKKTQLATGW